MYTSSWSAPFLTRKLTGGCGILRVLNLRRANGGCARANFSMCKTIWLWGVNLNSSVLMQRLGMFKNLISDYHVCGWVNAVCLKIYATPAKNATGAAPRGNLAGRNRRPTYRIIDIASFLRADVLNLNIWNWGVLFCDSYIGRYGR